jgi:gas vesicle protein
MVDDRKLSYFFLGLGVGVAVGIIFAPKSGRETRTIIRSKADEGREFLKKRSEDIRESASTIIEKGKEVVDKGRDVVERQRGHLDQALEAGRQAYRDALGRKPAEPTEEQGV